MGENYDDTLQKAESAFDNFDEDTLKNYIAENSKIVDELEFENMMMERYIKKFDIKIEPAEEASVPEISRVSRKRSRSKGFIPDRTLKLTAEQKCTIAQTEIEDFKQETITLQEVCEKIIDDYKAVLEEADIQLREARKFMYEIDKDLIKNAALERFNAVVAEKLVRFLEEYIRSRDTLIDKLRLRHTTLRIQKKKLHAQLRQKEEMGEVLHEVDFEQLKIENAEFMSTIEIKNKELLRLKHSTGITLQVLNAYRRKLYALIEEGIQLRSEIQSKKDLTKRTMIEIESSRSDKEQVEVLKEDLKRLMNDYRVPGAMEYVDRVREMNLLKRKEKIQQRKVEIAKIAVLRHRRLWADAKMSVSARKY